MTTISGSALPTDVVISSVLRINNSSVGSLKGFSGGFINWAENTILAAKSTAYWSDDGQGAMTKALVTIASLFVSSAILDENVRKRIPGVSNYPVSEEYKEWKEEKGLGSLYGRLTGSLGHNIAPVKNPGGGWSVGVRKGVMPLPVRGEARGNYPVAAYAQMLEAKYDYSQPLLAPIVSYWLQKHFPAWGKTFNTYWQLLYAEKGGMAKGRREILGLGSGDIKGGSTLDLTGSVQDSKAKNVEVVVEQNEYSAFINTLAQAMVDFSEKKSVSKKDSKLMNDLMARAANSHMNEEQAAQIEVLFDSARSGDMDPLKSSKIVKYYKDKL